VAAEAADAVTPDDLGVEDPGDAESTGAARPLYRRPWFRLVAGAVVLAIAVVTLLATTTQVPNVMDLDKIKAITRIKASNVFTARLVYDTSSSEATGTVIAQDPPAWMRRHGGVIVLTIAGPESVAVPNMVGLSQTEAARILQASGLEVGEVKELPNLVHANLVVFSQSPAAAGRVEYMSTVSLSLAPMEIEVPELVEWGDALKEDLQRAGLRLGGVKGVIEPTIGPGFIVSQDPAAGRHVSYDSTVSIEVAVRNPVERQVLGEWKRVDSYDKVYDKNTSSWTFLNDFTWLNGYGYSSTWMVTDGNLLQSLGTSQTFRVKRDGKYLNVWDPPNASKPTRKYVLVKEVKPFPPDPKLPGVAR